MPTRESPNYDDRLSGQAPVESRERTTDRPTETPRPDTADAAQGQQIISDTRSQLTDAGILPKK